MAHDVPFKLGTFSAAGSPPYAGLVLDESVVAVAPLLARLDIGGAPPATINALLQDWDASFARLQALANRLAAAGLDHPRWADAVAPATSLRVLPPVSPPGQLFQSGANYRTHVIDLMVAQRIGARAGMTEQELRAEAERIMDERAARGTPYVFLGLPSSLTGAYDDVILPREGNEHDWELELAVVIGRPARHVPRERALDYVAGYTISNDLTTRDRVFRPDLASIGSDWLRSKNAPTFFPTGPYLVPSAFVPRPMDLRLTLRLNGEVMQDATTADMICDIARLIEYTSAITELRPGDLLLTGSPAGNGAHWRRFLRPGDVMEGEIAGLGRQRNRCVAEAEVAGTEWQPTAAAGGY